MIVLLRHLKMNKRNWIMTNRARKYFAAKRQRRRGYYCPFPEDFNRLNGPIIVERMDLQLSPGTKQRIDDAMRKFDIMVMDAKPPAIHCIVNHDPIAIQAHMRNHPISWVDEMALYPVPKGPGLMDILMNPPVVPWPSPGTDDIIDIMASLMGQADKRIIVQPLLMSAEGLAIFDKAVKGMLANPVPRTPPPPAPVVEKKPIEIVDRYAEGPGTVLTEDIITLLGFGEYWGESGEFGSRSLTDPENDQKYIMRIYDMDEMEAGSYGGYYQAETSPQHFCTSEFMQMNTLGELYDDARRRYPKALPVLIENAKKTMLWYPNE